MALQETYLGKNVVRLKPFWAKKVVRYGRTADDDGLVLLSTDLFNSHSQLNDPGPEDSLFQLKRVKF